MLFNETLSSFVILAVTLPLPSTGIVSFDPLFFTRSICQYALKVLSQRIGREYVGRGGNDQFIN